MYAVEIDPEIVALGRKLHAERPYDNPRVHLTVNDARSFFQRTEMRFAMVVFGFLDSHTLLSSFSSVRLDNFVYTLESLKQVRRILKPGGRVALTFASNTRWIDQRLQKTLDQVFDRPTQVIAEQHRRAYTNGILYVNYKDREVRLPSKTRDRRPAFVATDDWPFLYLKGPRLPRQYIPFMIVVVMLGFVPLFFLPRGQRRIRLPYFFLGAGFFLLEASNVVNLSLMYGSTWTVNVLVFSGILVLVLLGNLLATVVRLPLAVWFAALVAMLAVAGLTPTAALLGIPSPVLKAVAAVVVFLGPVLFAAVVFATLIRDEDNLPQAYGSNVLGAVVGGAMEYLSLMMGFKFLLGVTALFYLVVFLFLPRTQRR